MGYPVSVNDAGTGIATAVLVGGPATIPGEFRSHQVALPCEKIKVAHNGGYEHFALAAGEAAPGPELIFKWVTRTRIAE